MTAEMKEITTVNEGNSNDDNDDIANDNNNNNKVIKMKIMISEIMMCNDHS